MRSRECITCPYYKACQERAADSASSDAFTLNAVPEASSELLEFNRKTRRLQGDRLDAGKPSCRGYSVADLAISRLKSRILGYDWVDGDEKACHNPALNSSEFSEAEISITASGLVAQDRQLREEAGQPPIEYFTDRLVAEKISLTDKVLLGAGAIATAGSVFITMGMHINTSGN